MSDRPKAPSLPATDASTTPGSRYEQVAPSDVPRRIPDLPRGDLVAFEGEVRRYVSEARVRVLRSSWEAPQS